MNKNDNRTEDVGLEGVGCAVVFYFIAVVFSAFMVGIVFALLRMIASVGEKSALRTNCKVADSAA